MDSDYDKQLGPTSTTFITISAAHVMSSLIFQIPQADNDRFMYLQSMLASTYVVTTHASLSDRLL